MIKPDRQTIMQVFGSLMHRPQYLSDTDKFIIEVNDFDTTFDRYIFLAIYNLYKSGAERIHAIDIDNYLQNDAAGAKIVMENNDGIQFLNDCETYCEAENFNYYYNKLKKFNLLKDLQKEGYDISEFYAEDPLMIDSFDINARFEKLTTEDILNKVKGKIATIEKSYLTNAVVQEGKASDGIRDLIKELKQVPEIGCSLQGEYFNTIVRGGRKGKLYLRSAASGVGKAIPNYTIIPTLNGWKKVEDIKVGDFLFDKNGKPTEVLAIYPQKEKKQIYRVYFESGRIAECCDEHLWSYYNSKSRNKNKLFTSTVKELLEKSLKDIDGEYQFSVPINKPLQYLEKDYDIDPYTMGSIIGIESRIFKYPRLQECCCSEIFEEGSIPLEYLQGSIDQRMELLSGLLDAAGTIDKNGIITFTTVSQLLRNNLIELCRSLRINYTYDIDINKEKKLYTFHLWAEKSTKMKMFKSKRKRDMLENYLNNTEETKDRDAIIKIEPTKIFVDMTCFYVDNEEHLFLMNDFIVTHNTRSMVGDACYIAYPIRWENGEWIESGRTPQKVLYVATEQDVDEIQTMILAYLTGINEEKFLYGIFTEEEMPRIEKAIEIMEKYSDYMLTARIPNPCSSVVKNLFRRYNLQYEVENFFYDYIFSSPAMLDEYRDLAIREDVALRLFTTTLKNLATELNSFILTSTQISNDNNNDEGGFRDYKYIRGSRAIVDLVDLACIMSRPSKNELEILTKAEQISFDIPNVVTDVFKNRRGRWTQVRIWSRNDLGCCRKKDLFLTDINLNPINNFSIINFKEENSIELPEFSQDNFDTSELLNTEERVKEAFGDTKKRIKDVSIDELLS